MLAAVVAVAVAEVCTALDVAFILEFSTAVVSVVEENDFIMVFFDGKDEL